MKDGSSVPSNIQSIKHMIVSFTVNLSRTLQGSWWLSVAHDVRT